MKHVFVSPWRKSLYGWQRWEGTYDRYLSYPEAWRTMGLFLKKKKKTPP